MRLYLSSNGIGDRAGSLLAFLGGGKRAVVIENAQDHISTAARELFRREGCDPVAELASLGIAGTPLDLRDHFGDPAGLRAQLNQFDLAWVTGGNAFVLRRAMKQSGFDDVIAGMLDNDEIAYGGFSAGAVVAGPNLEGIHLMDDPDEVPPGYDREVAWDGLGLIDHAIVPHYRSPHPESAAAERAVRHLCARGLRYRALRDGEVVVWTETRRVSVVPQLRIA
ncbi:MAG: Type 1 glutamine amidotransferase-like domain-containing protein [Devosia sp.]|uniref:Type 1 glutamine amidotransferase-like domain-containing protein n=1 Tax=Devosia sp. TaxID=1871048 RepID=UPI001ACBED17|nr:Type 1 glutamine amidotransferase-like domain-containing protein [Devosia sp.]MBN9317301.1 Type 1 glutamine amidotransferase-like domain-containing protein [Devosia sp.]